MWPLYGSVEDVVISEVGGAGEVRTKADSEQGLPHMTVHVSQGPVHVSRDSLT